MALCWYAARTEPRFESMAAASLERDGIEIFFPQIKVSHPRLGQTNVPLFPGYLFLQCDVELYGWPSFHPAHRLLGWLEFDGEVPSLPDEAIAALKVKTEHINSDGVLRDRFNPGDLVRIDSGAIQGFAEVLEDAKSPEARVKILLEFAGRTVQAQVPWDALQLIDGSKDSRIRIPRRTRGRGRWVNNISGAVAQAR